MPPQSVRALCGYALGRSCPVLAQCRRIGLPTHHSRLITCKAYTIRKGEDEGEVMLELSEYLTKRAASSAPGVYAMYNSDRVLQFIGFGKDIFRNMREHMERVSEDQRKFVRAKVFANAAMATPDNMAREAQHWVEEEGGVLPPGNGVDAKLWTLSDGAVGPLSSDASQPSASGKADTDGVMVSPFTQAQVHRTVGQFKGEGLEMTVDTVDKALDEVRPYLRADGGDVDVVNVEDGNVYLRLEGRCNSCASSSATMSMGIERALRAAFGDKLKEVIQVDQGPQGATKQAVNELLNLLRPAISSYNGKVEVVSVESGVCRVFYQGPDPIWVGVRAAIRDKFSDITEVQRCESVASTNGTE